MRIIVTGGAGFIGSHIVDRCVEAGHEVGVVDNLSTGKRANVNAKARFFEQDICEAGLAAVFEGFKADIVIHEAAQVNVRRSVEDPAHDARVNVLGTINVFRTAGEAGCKKVIYASSGGACYGEPPEIPAPEDTRIRPLCPYGVSKYAAEKYLELYADLYGMDYTILRYGNVYGPRQDPHGEAGVVAVFSELMLAGKQPQIFGDGSKTRDYVFVGDVARANVLALEKGNGGIFNIGTGVQTTDDEIYFAVRNALGLDIEAIHTDFRPGEVMHIALDIARARRELGWAPEHTLATGMPLTIAWRREGHPSQESWRG